MNNMKKVFRTLLTFVLVALGALVFTLSSSAAEGKWITAWGTGPTELRLTGYSDIASLIGPVTARSIITPTASGSKVRFLVSNRFGDEPITINSMYVAKHTTASKIDVNSSSPITFDGRAKVVIPAGEERYSDVINFAVSSMENIAVSIFTENFGGFTTMGLSGGKTYVTMGEKDMTKEEALNLINEKEFTDVLEAIFGDLGIHLSSDLISVMPCVVSMDVLSDASAYSAVVIGDSTVANEFPLELAKTIYEKGIYNVGIVGKGIFGNSLMANGLGLGDIIYADSVTTRLNRDVFSQTGVDYVIVKAGINDIVHPVSTDAPLGSVQPTADELIEGYKKLFKLCHNKGKKVIVVGITQWKGSTRDYFNNGPQYVRTDKEFQRDWQIAKDVNEWLASTNEHDGFVDWTAVSSGGSKDADAILPDYTADGVHPTKELQKIWAQNFPLSLIGVGTKVAGVVFNTTKLTVYKNSTKKLTASVYPESALNKKVTWTSSDESVATVTDGKIKGIKNGSAVITCTTEEGGYTAKCKVTVRTKAEGVVLEKSAGEIHTTKGLYIKAKVIPEDASDKTITYTSSNPNVATVSSKGYVRGVGAGKTSITVTDSAGNKATFTIRVLKKVQVTAINLNYMEKGVYTGKTFTLKPEIFPEDATYPDVEWVSSDEKIATVSEDGVVKGIRAGKVRITCKSVDNPMVSQTCIVTVKVRTMGVTLNYSKITVYTTTTKQLKATISPSNATNKKVTWESEDPDIASVDKNGVVSGKKVGTTYIICTTNNSERTAICKVTVKKGVLSKKVTLNKTKLTINDGMSYALKATLSPSNTTTKTCTWSSSNKKVVTVTSKGVITAVGPGTAVITCKTKDTGKIAKCTVTVKKVVPSSVVIDKSYYEVGYKKTIQLTATVSPDNASDKTLIWTSSNPKYAKVSSTGKVTGLKSGKTVTITVTTKSGKKVDSCKVYVGSVDVSGVKLNKSSATMGAGSTLQLKATITPSTATNKNVKWASSNTKVAKVNSKGLVTAVANGTALISCTTVDGEIVAICKITVKTVKVMGIKLNKNSTSLNVGDSETLKATIVPGDASNQNVKWESTDSSVAKVNSKGKITAVSSGVVRIRAVTEDGSYVGVCIVTVR